MTQDQSKRPWGFGLAVATLALACVILGAINIRRWLETRRRAVETLDANSSPASADPLPSDPGPVPSGPSDESGAMARGKGDVQGAEHDPSPLLAAGAPPETAGSPGGADLTSPTVHGSPQPVTGETVAPRQEGLPSEAGAASPEASRTPEEETPAGSDASSDRTPPVLGPLRFEPAVVEGGSATTLTIQATDTLSGVKSVRGEIQSPSGSATLPIGLQETQDGHSFTYVMNIPPAAETGVWFVKWLHLTDVANNSALIQAASARLAPPGGTFSVSSSESDSIPPDVVEVSFDKEEIEDEDWNLIRVEVRDDLSGVASVTGACRSPSGSALIPFTCALNAESGLWEGNIMLPESAACGVWSVQQLSAKDKAGNTTHLTAESRTLGHVGFTVAPRANCDSSPPTLDGFALSQTIVPGDVATEILVSATVHDEGSGAASMTGWFEGPVSEGGQPTKNYFNCTPDPENPEAPWTGKVLVPQFAPKGLWKVRVIRLEDKARNAREYTPGDPVLSGGAFEVR
jgi:hypothetical protein